MKGILLIIVALAILGYVNLTTAECKGCVALDEFSFGKIVPKFNVVLVKFDAAFPYGDKHDAYVHFAGDYAANKRLLIAEVGIKDYGDRDNEAFAQLKGVNITNLPSIRLYTNGGQESYEFDPEMKVSRGTLRRFIMDHSELYLALSGCVEELDKIVMEFVKDVNNKKYLQEAKSAAEKLDGKDKDASKFYIAYIEKINIKGLSYVDEEMSRLKKIITDGKITPQKKIDLEFRLNILYSFRKRSLKDEL